MQAKLPLVIDVEVVAVEQGHRALEQHSLNAHVTKSYQKLLDRELISNQRGRGYFVSENAAERALQEMREEFMRDELPRIVGAMRLLGIGMEEIAGPLSRSGNPEPGGDDTS